MSLSPIDHTQRRNSEEKLNFRCFSSWGPESAYYLGLIWADGTLSTPRKGSKRVVLVSTDKELIDGWVGFTGSPNPAFTKEKHGPRLQSTDSVAFVIIFARIEKPTLASCKRRNVVLAHLLTNQEYH